MLPEFLSFPSMVATYFVILWLFRAPHETWQSLTFKNEDGVMGHLISFVTILYFVGFLNFLFFLFKKFAN